MNEFEVEFSKSVFSRRLSGDLNIFLQFSLSSLSLFHLDLMAKFVSFCLSNNSGNLVMQEGGFL